MMSSSWLVWEQNSLMKWPLTYGPMALLCPSGQHYLIFRKYVATYLLPLENDMPAGDEF